MVYRTVTLMWFFCFSCLMPATAFGSVSERSVQKDSARQVGSLQLPFIRNQGQLGDPAVRFYADTAACRLLVTDKGRLLYDAKGPSPAPSTSKQLISERLVDAAKIALRGEAPSPTRYHILKSGDPKNWHRDIASYHSLDMGPVYEGIRMNLRYHHHNVEKLFFLDPGADANQILLAVNHVSDLGVNKKGELVLRTDRGAMHFSKPVAYQMSGAERQMVAVDYRIQGHTYGFKLGPYDASKPLIIDPLVNSYSIESKGEHSFITAMASDDQGNVYGAGISNNDFVVYQFNPQIDEITAFAQFCNTPASYSSEFVTGIALDSQNNVFVVGFTENEHFPVTAGCVDNYIEINGSVEPEGFIIKFDSNLTRILAATFLGGDERDRLNGIAIDPDDNIYVAGDTRNINFPNDEKFPLSDDAFDTNHGEESFRQKGFVSKLNNDLTTLLASTLLGGNTGSFGPADTISGIALDTDGKVYVGGGTDSPDFPIHGGMDTTLTGESDAFVARFDANLTTLEASTFLGGMNNEEIDEQVKTLLVDGNSPPNIYAAGWTSSTDFPMPQGYDTSHNREEDGFIVKLNMDLTQIHSATFLGGHGKDEITCMALAPGADGGEDFLIVGGRTESDNFPTTKGCHDASFGGNATSFIGRRSNDTGDGFISFFDHELSRLTASTFFGGERLDYVDALMVSGANVFVCGETVSDDDFLPLMPNSESIYATRGYIARFNANGGGDGNGDGGDDDRGDVDGGSNGGGGGGCFLRICLP